MHITLFQSFLSSIYLNCKMFSFYFIVENTRKVAKNLGCRNPYDGNMGANRVDVLIPDVIQVFCCLKFQHLNVIGLAMIF